jgi:hypothetical protein
MNEQLISITTVAWFAGEEIKSRKNGPRRRQKIGHRRLESRTSAENKSPATGPGPNKSKTRHGPAEANATRLRQNQLNKRHATGKQFRRRANPSDGGQNQNRRQALRTKLVSVLDDSQAKSEPKTDASRPWDRARGGE